ncbi:MAG: Na+/H+ antiporter NhaA, partial [Bacteroidota bacterium]
LWINDGLMAVFFFVIGLEIKREVLAGELASPRKAALALAAAAGGMVAPALFYVLVNLGEPTISGWGIPMATDIAFALGVLAILGKRVPVALKIFLTALAIVDDLGAVLVIALFYTAKLSWVALGAAAGLYVLLMGLNKAGVRQTSVYAILGTLLWLAFLKSGVHATIAGVLLATTIPATRVIDAEEFLQKGKKLLANFAGSIKGEQTKLTHRQRDAISMLEQTCEDAEAPLARLEHSLHGVVAFAIMPIFALANAGVAFGAGGGSVVTPVSLGVLLGLLVGKPVGVFGFAWIAVKMKIASLPVGVTWRHILGVSFLTGIGFTMAIFIANLAFAGSDQLDLAKMGILAASFVAGVIGYSLLRTSPEVVDGPEGEAEDAYVVAEAA